MKVLVCLILVGLSCISWVSGASSAKLSCNCGWRNTGRIVGGKETRKNEYPWMAFLSNGCGGSIITPYHVLTAAHCTYEEKASRINVSVGMHYQTSGKNPHLQLHRVAQIIQHKDYLYTFNAYNDISILKLATPIRFSQFVGPVCLPSSRFNLVGKFVKLTGWGITKGTGDDNGLREIDVQVVDNKGCKENWPLLDSNSTQICTYTPKKASCSGDSGGAYVYLDPATNRYTEVALVSYGHPDCGTAPLPTVNTDVFAYINWIKQAVAQKKQHICTKV